MRNFEKYCKDYENIENYEKAKAENFIGWDCHHRREAEFSRKELITLGIYYNRPAEELIFIRAKEHISIHKKGNQNFQGKHHSEETKKKMSDAAKNMSNEHRRKLSEAAKKRNLSDETKKKIAEALKGRKCTEETKKKMSKAHKGNTASKGMRWYNNGKENRICFECPPGYEPGMLKRK